MTPEGRVKAMVKRALAKLSHIYKFMPVQNGMGAPGLDFYCCWDGWFIAIETKKSGAKLTPRQRTTAGDIVAAGGAVLVIRDTDDIEYMMCRLRAAPDILMGKLYDTLGE